MRTALLPSLLLLTACPPPIDTSSELEVVVTISPETPDTTTTLTAVVDGVPQGAPVEYTWTVDGQPTTVTGDTVSPDLTARGQTWRVSIAVALRTGTGQAADEVEIANSAPVVASAAISVDPVGACATLRCTPGATADADGDEVSAIYRWQVDGAPRLPTSDRLGLAEFDDGDEVVCFVTPTDGADNGGEVASAAFTVAGSNLTDADGDDVCDAGDQCEGDDGSGDSDLDGVCDDVDACAGDDASGDSDGDGVCDSDDLCVGADSSGDSDSDGVCDDSDACTGDDATGDVDGDGRCDDLDLCFGDDTTGDPDSDYLCNDKEAMLGTGQGVPDTDGDGLKDGDEVAWAGSDPGRSDSDSGGLNDADEVKYGLDPNDPNDDGGTGKRRVFVTAATYPATLGGLPGADARCAAEAVAGGLLGAYRAMLSTSSVDLVDRVEEAIAIRPDGVVVASNQTDLTDWSLAQPINVGPDGAPVGSPNTVWSGSTASGTAEAAATCGDWTSTADLGAVGSTVATSAAWLANGTQPCTASARLYCIGYADLGAALEALGRP